MNGVGSRIRQARTQKSLSEVARQDQCGNFSPIEKENKRRHLALSGDRLPTSLA